MTKKLFKSFAVLLAALVLLSALPFTASAAVATQDSVGVRSGTTGDCSWSFDNGVLTISGNGKMGDNYCFGNMSWKIDIKGVIISDGVTGIGSSAFSGCSNLTNITIPDSVTSIDDSAFRACKSLTGITIPDSVTSIGDSAFRECTSLTGITIPDSVTSIGNYAFYYCTSLTGITIPDSVTSISGSAFRRCISLTSVTIGNSVTSIGESAFKYCTSLTSVTIPDSVTSIGENAFKYCTSLTSVTIPDSVTSIGEYAFKYCTNLTSITIPDSVTSIGEYAFYNCEKITIHCGFDSYACAYAERYGIPYVIDEVSGTIGDCSLSFDKNTGVLTISGNGSMGDVFRLYNVSWKNYVKSVVILKGVTSIGNSAFSGCTSITSVTIGDSVTSIGDRAFYNCTSLTNITIPESVTNIGDMAFGYISASRKVEGFTIYGKTGSSAERYAKANGFAFVSIGTQPTVTKGDVNLDGSVDIKDVTEIQSALAEFKALTDEQGAAADVDGNGEVTVADATRLQMYLAEFDVELG